MSERYKVIDSSTPTISTEYYDNGQIKERGQIIFLFQRKVGTWNEYYPGGEQFREYGFHESIPNRKEGDWKWYDESGKTVRWEKFRNGSIEKIVVDGEIEK